jgi:hypothetical protein
LVCRHHLRQEPYALKCARADLCGGRPVTGVPTATNTAARIAAGACGAAGSGCALSRGGSWRRISSAVPAEALALCRRTHQRGVQRPLRASAVVVPLLQFR